MLFLVLYKIAYLVIYSNLRVAGIAPGFLASLWFQMFFQITALLLPLAIWLAFFRERVNQHLPHMRLGKTNLLYIAGLSIFLQPVLMIISGLTNLIFPNEIAQFVMGQVEYPFWVLILVVAITPAICEEVVFRGYIQSTFKGKPFWIAALINGLLFAIFHFNAHQFFFTFFAGIFFAYIVHATRSIRAAVISHFILNASQVTIMWILMNMPVEEEYYPGDIYFDAPPEIADPAIIGAIVFIILFAFILIGSSVVSIYLFRGFVRHNKKRVDDYNAKTEAEESSEHAGELGEAAETEETAEEPEAPEASAPANETPAEKRKNFFVDGAIILAIVAVYVFIIFA